MYQPVAFHLPAAATLPAVHIRLFEGYDAGG